MKRAFKRPQTIVYRACRIVAMRLTYTFARDISFQRSTDVSRPLTEFARSFLTSFEGEGKGRWTGRVGGIGRGSSSAKTFRAGKIVGLDRKGFVDIVFWGSRSRTSWRSFFRRN